MPVDSQYTDRILEWLRAEGEPRTAAQISEAVGMTRQGAYFWLNHAGRAHVRPAGVGANKGRAYVVRDPDDEGVPSRGTWDVLPHARGGAGDASSLPLGSRWTVRGLEMGPEGETVVKLESDEGEAVAFAMPEGR